MGSPEEAYQPEVFNNYLVILEPEFKPTLTELYALIRLVVPEAEEVIDQFLIISTTLIF